MSPRSPRRQPRARFLLGASVSTLLLAAAPAFAGSSSSNNPFARVSDPAAAAAQAAQSQATQTTQANAIAAQTAAAFQRVTNAVSAAQAAQAAARSAAAAAQSSVANGLVPGGLVVDPRVTAGTDPNLWVNASGPVQTTSNGQTTVTIDQTSQRAILTWQSFNVGRNTTVYFNQSAGNTSTGNSWIALNRIDATGNPSTIEGQIKAEGTVMLINPNGVIFTGTSQVNVHSIIAAAMDINGYSGGSNFGVFNNTGSYVAVPGSGGALAPINEDSANQTFLTSGLFINNTINVAGTSGQAFFASAPTSVAGPNAGVQVQAGAQINAAVSGTDNGGTVALLGPQTSNAGSISAPSGQVILAAGSMLGLSEPAAGGIDMAVISSLGLATGSPLPIWTPTNAMGTLGGVATNASGGVLSADRGNVTLVGDTVQQLGDIEVTTSITRAGSITLQAAGEPSLIATAPGSYLGSVVFGPGSVTAILPSENGETIPSNSLSTFVAPSISVVNAAGVDFQPGSFVEAPGASFSIGGVYSPGSNSPPTFGRVLLESGSTIDLSGTSATVPLSDYLYTFKVTANDIADTPLAQSLIGQTVTINLLNSGVRADSEAWVGSPLFASSGAGYLGDVAQSIDQLLSKGGSFTVAKGFTDFVQAPGSTINVSGGAISFTGGVLNTTRLLASNGEVFDIGSADPSLGYVGLAGFVESHPHWGVSTSWSSPFVSQSIYTPSYVDGMSAGGVNISAVNPILEGTITGDVLVGQRQRALAQAGTGTNGAQATPDQLPQGASLTLNLGGGAIADEVVLAESAPELLPAGFNYLTSNFLSGAGPLAPPLPGVLPTDAFKLPVITYSTAQLTSEDLGSITIKGASLLSMQPGAALAVRPGGSVAFNDAATIDGTITARAGTINIAGFQPGGVTGFPVAYDNLVLGPNATLDVSGLWVNDTNATAGTMLGKAYTNGGSVSLTTYEISHSVSTTTSNGIVTVTAADDTESIVLQPGSVIDVTSGGYVGANGKLALGSNGLPSGTGGSVSLIVDAYYVGWASDTTFTAGYDPTTINYAPTNLTNATVVMGGTIRAGGLAGGGAFSLEAPTIVIDGAAGAVSSPTSGAGRGTITLPTSFFQQGFSAYNLTGVYGGVTITPGTTLRLEQPTYQLTNAATLTGASLASFATLGFAPDDQRPAASLSLTELPFTFGQTGDPSTTAGVTLGAGASILTDPGASITFISGQAIDIFGAITDHGGAVTLAGAQDSWIGSGAVIDVSGTFAPSPLVTDYSTGTELAGGSITFGLGQVGVRIGYSSDGPVIVNDGAVLDIAGGQAMVQAPGPGLQRSATVAFQPIWSDGGSLVFNGGGDLFLGGTIKAAGGAPQAAGGTLELGQVVVGSLEATRGVVNNAFGSIALSQAADPGAAFASAAAPQTATQLTTLLSQANAGGNTAYVTANTLSGSGLSTVVLDAGAIKTTGNVSVSGLGELDLAGQLVLPATGGSVVNLGANYIRLFGYAQTAPTSGDGTLNLNASQQIDIEGAVSVSGAAKVDLTSGGDIRLIWADGSVFSTPLISFPIQADSSTAATPTLGATSLNVADDLTLTAREVYVSTGTQGALLSLGLGTHSTITIASNGQATYTPLSAGGSLLVDAPAIVQDGALFAPLGSIQLGVSASEPAGVSLVGAAPLTTNVTLGAGSLTSVSIAGLDIPYGYTINGNWQETALPEKQVVLAGTNITTQAGATLNLAGGGDVYATEFVAGTGGSRNLLTTTSQTVYALVPGGEADVAAVYPTGGYNLASWGAGGTDAASGFSVQAGMTVTLQGGHGVPGGTYVLMPAMYATMPGAYRVVVGASTAMSGVPASYVGADGTIYATGVLGNAVTGEKSALTTGLQIQPQSVWSKYSEIDISSADSAFTATAQANGQVTPRLPIDAGHLILAATGALNFNATDNFATGSATDASGKVLTGRGGLADITGSDLLVVAADQASAYAANPAYAGATLLDADQLSNLGVASLLVGGVRSTTTSGVSIAPAAVSLTVATDAAHPLTAPDLILATTGSITSSTASTPINAATGSQTAVIGAGLAGITSGTSITLYSASTPLDWVQGTVTSYDPASGAVTFSGASIGGSGQITGATVLIATPSLGTGLTVADGSVIKAVGSVPTGSSQNISIGANPVVTATNANTGAVTAYTPGISGDGALLRVSNGDDIIVSRAFVPGLYSTASQPAAFGTVSATPEGALTIGAATLSGNAITLDSSGTDTLAAAASLSAAHYTLGGSLINLGGSNPSGLTLTPSALARFAGAQSVTLHSSSVFNLYGQETFGSASAPIGTLILDGAGFNSDGGQVSIAADNVTFQDSQGSVGGGAAGAGGGLQVAASSVLTIGQGIQTWTGLSQVSLSAGTEVLFSGGGSVTAGAADITLTSPAVVADSGAAQSLTTTGALTLAPTGGALPTLASSVIGGNVALTGAAVSVSNAILAPGGAVTLEATTGDLNLAPGASIAAQGSRITLLGVFNEDVPAGSIRLIADAGNVTIGAGATVNVSAAGDGYAGTVSISAPLGTATLNGAMLGAAAYKDLGGSFLLNAGRLAGSLPQGSSFSGAYSVTLGQGDITVAAGQTISSGTILLVANDGSVTVDGTLDASGPTGGVISLFGAGATHGSGASATVTGGVNIGAGAQLIARYAADDPNDPASANGQAAGVQNGGTITLGVSGVGSTTNLDPVEGYEIVPPGQSGWINVASGATFDVSGGPGGANISNTGGAVYLRAPIVENADGSNRTVNVDFSGAVITNADANGHPSGKGVVLQPYATWSTADQQTDLTKYFDGVIDPVGWYSNTGALLLGTFKDASGNVLLNYTGGTITLTNPGVATQGTPVSLGTQAFTVAAGLDLPAGAVVMLSATSGGNGSLTGTVVSYNSVTGALVIAATSANGSLALTDTWTVTFAATGTLVSGNYSITNGIGVYTDPSGGTYFEIVGITLPSGVTVTPGEQIAFQTETSGASGPAAALEFTGTVSRYGISQISYLGNGLDFYSPAFLSAWDAGEFSANFNISAPLKNIILGAGLLNTTVSVARTQPFVIGYGARLLNFPTGLAYTSGSAISLTDDSTPSDWMVGSVTSYNASTGLLAFNVVNAFGVGQMPSGVWDVSTVSGGQTQGATVTGTPNGQRIQTGVIGFTFPTGLPYTENELIALTDHNAPNNWLTGSVFSYDPSTGKFSINVYADSGAGNLPSNVWNIAVAPGPGQPSGTIITTGPNQPFAVGLDIRALTVPAGLALTAGAPITVTDANNTNDWMQGVISSYNQTTGLLSFEVINDSGDGNVGSGAWTLGVLPLKTTQTRPYTIGTGVQAMTLQGGLGYSAGERINLIDSANTADSMTGTVISYNNSTGAATFNIASDTGDGNTVSGTWNISVVVPQSVINGFLANDYFTPNSANANHQAFYGFNPATGAPGALMSFVQNPFAGNDAAALSGLSGATIQIGSGGAPTSLSAAQALHVSPEMDLVNPQTSVNGGDISVLTNWNLGAGVAGPDGNPTSLYYRYNGWAPTLTLRAVNDVNIDASITDGFFQKLPNVGGDVAIPAGTTTLYTTIIAASSYITLINNSNNLFLPVNLSRYGDLVPTNPAAYQMIPPVNYSGQNYYYTIYTKYFSNYSTYYTRLSANFGKYESVANGGTPPSAAVTTALDNANALYSSTNPIAYTAYSTAYTAYLTAWNSWQATVPGAKAALPVAPLPPPAISALPGSILNLPAVNNVPAPTATALDKSPIANMDLVAEASSSSYRFVAGAQFGPGGGAPADPEAVVAAGASGGGDVTLSGHMSYTDTGFGLSSGGVTYYPRVDVPTIVRTGTGSIDMVASGDIEWLDALSPAAVYTAGTVAPNAAGFTVPTLPSTAASGATTTGFVSTPTWATGGGAVTLSAGRDIVGIETPVDSEQVLVGSGAADAQTLGDNAPSMAQFWSAWYIPLSKTSGEAATPFDTTVGGVQNSAYINYATFFQGVGALGGGNVTVNSGRNTYDLSVSLPETIQVSGGRFVGDSAPTVHDFGGGDLSVTVGGNLYSSDFYVGRGSGVVRVTGSVLADPANPVTGKATEVYPSSKGDSSSSGLHGVPVASTLAGQLTPAPLLLAEQDGYITVEAGGSLTLGGVFEPTRISPGNYPYAPNSYLPAGFGAGFDSYGAGSGVTVMAAGGDLSLLDALPPSLASAMAAPVSSTLATGNLLPPTLEAISVAGDLTIANAHATGIYRLYPSADGNLILAAGQDLSGAQARNLLGVLTISFAGIDMVDATTFGGVPLYSEVGTPTPTTLPAPLHADDPDPALILAGEDIIGSFQLIKPGQVEAGRDILDTAFTGQNNSPDDVTSIVAGRDIRSTDVIGGVTYALNSAGASPGITGNIGNTQARGATVLMLYGPGQFEVSAGRDLGPFLAFPYADTGGGIFAVGNGSNIGKILVQGQTTTGIIPYLPVQGADINVQFGVGGGVNYAGAISAYVDPAGTGAAQGIDFLPEIAGYMGVSIGDAWSAFQALPAQKQDLLVDRAFLDFLTQVGTDYRNPQSPYYAQYARAYDAISTLFPASAGYTDNNTGESNGASTTVHTGDLWMARSRLETQTGGDINILGPGGSIIVGANQADKISPSLEGILTLQGGSIRAYVDDDVQIYQSRVFTEQGGDIDLFSANGDLNAGKGPKSSAAYPPLQLICDTDGYCRVSPAGLVTGAGIGALLTLPGQNPALSNASLVAPHGTVDAGAAGIRVAGNLDIIALQVLNAYNIQVGGTATGIPTTVAVNIGALTSAGNASAAVALAAQQIEQQHQPSPPPVVPTVVTVKLLGFGDDQ